MSACRASSVGEADSAPARTNIVLIVADDLGWSDLGVQGSGFYETPHIDALARSGMRFTAAYSNGPNCAPTRASLMSGQYSPRHGIFTVRDPLRGALSERRLVPPENAITLDPSQITLAEVLERAGYTTGHFGKWHLGDPGTAGPEEQGFDVNVGGSLAGHPRTYFSPYDMEAIEDGPPREYLTDRLTAEAVRFIETHRDDPFFVYLPYYAVHTPIEAKKTVAARFAGKTPWHGQSNADYAAMIHSLDAGVGRILQALDRLDLAENTLVVFTSDNGGLGGYASSGTQNRSVTDNYPLKGGKGQLYEGGIRIPLIVRWPGVTDPGSTSDVPTLSIDLYPTLIEAAGVPLPTDQVLDGASLVPVLHRSGPLHRDAIFWFFPAYLQARDGLRTAPAAAVRSGRHKLIWFFEDDRLELYDLQDDEGERRNLASIRPDTADRLQRVLRSWIASMDAPMPSPNPAYEGSE